MDGRPRTCFWKDVRTYLESIRDDPASNLIAPVAMCSICQVRELSIPGLPVSNTRFVSLEDIESGERLASVTVCGHLACTLCLHEWLKTQLLASRPRDLTCPVCRLELYYTDPGCPHIISGYILMTDPQSLLPDRPKLMLPFSDAGLSYLEHVPLTIPEGGKRPEKCWDCRNTRAQAWVTELKQENEEKLAVLSARTESVSSSVRGFSVDSKEWQDAVNEMNTMFGERVELVRTCDRACKAIIDDLNEADWGRAWIAEP